MLNLHFYENIFITLRIIKSFAQNNNLIFNYILNLQYGRYLNETLAQVLHLGRHCFNDFRKKFVIEYKFVVRA